MTDIEIVRTLAEFEGIWPEDAASEPFELNPTYAAMARQRLTNELGFLAGGLFSTDHIADPTK